jgi:hypothetical protein
LAQHSKVKVWIAANVAAEEKRVLAAAEVQRKHPVAESGKNIRIRAQILISFEVVVNLTLSK